MVLGIRFCLFVKEGHKLAKDREIPRRWRVDTLVGHYILLSRRGCAAKCESTVRFILAAWAALLDGEPARSPIIMGEKGVSYHRE